MIFQESETVELKAIVVDDIKKEVIAFANCEGGKLYIGVLDDGREIQCVIFKEAKSYDELLKKGQPLTVTGNLESQTWNGKQYLQITVQAIEE